MSDPGQALARVLGKGSAHEGAHHWRVQRLTALALLLLAPWFIISLLCQPDLSYGALVVWSSNLFHASLLAILIACLCWHSQLGVQVVIEDYVRGWARMAGLVASAFVHVLLAVLGILAVARLALGNPI